MNQSVGVRYTCIREMSGLPGRFILRYIHSGYNDKTYTALERGITQSERVNQRLIEMLRVNPGYLERGEEPVFLDQTRVRDADEVIRARILALDPDAKFPQEMTIEYLVKTADQHDIGWEFLVFGDAKCERYPLNEQMENNLLHHESLRRRLWEKMEVACPWNLEEYYAFLRNGDERAGTIYERVELLCAACGKERQEFERITGLSHKFFQRLKKGNFKTSELSVMQIAESMYVSREWIREGEAESCFYPYDYRMKIYLLEHPEEREWVWKELYGEKHLTWAEKFRIIRKELRWSGQQMIEYLDIGYSENIYLAIESGRLRPDPFLLSHLCHAFYINPDYLYRNQEPVLLNNRRVRSEWVEINQRLGETDTSRNLKGIQLAATSALQSVEWVLCGDEIAREYPFHQVMEQKLWKNEEIRKWIWQEMGYQLEYPLTTEGAETPGERIIRIMEAYGLSPKEYADLIGVSPVLIANIRGGLQDVSRLVANRVALAMHIDVAWILGIEGDGRMRYPVDRLMKQYLCDHPEVRKKVMEKLKK